MDQVDKELLAELVVHEGMPALFEVMDQLIRADEARMLQSDVAKVAERDLLLNLARIEGARRLLSNLKTRVKSLKPKA